MRHYLQFLTLSLISQLFDTQPYNCVQFYFNEPNFYLVILNTIIDLAILKMMEERRLFSRILVKVARLDFSIVTPSNFKYISQRAKT